MKIGKPIRTYTVEPLRDPVPQTKPGKTPSPRPRERPKVAQDGTSAR